MTAAAEVVIADHVQLMKNSLCTKWMDVLELVRSQDIQILDRLGEDVSEEFIHAMDCYKKDVLQQTGSTDRAGISFRWLIGNKKGETEVLLMAQVRHVVYCCVLQYRKIQYDTTLNPVQREAREVTGGAKEVAGAHFPVPASPGFATTHQRRAHQVSRLITMEYYSIILHTIRPIQGASTPVRD